MIEVDEKLWPVVLIRYAAPIRQEDIEGLAHALTAIVERQQPFVAIADARRSEGLSHEQRQYLAEWIKRHDAALRKHCLGNATIVTSPLARLTFSIIIKLRPPPTPYTVVSTLEAAAVWAAERLVAAGHISQAQRVLSVHGPKVTPVPLMR
jgi:hypothetical protein